MKIKLKRLHPLQLEVKKSDKRFKILSNGRRWGKTTYIINELISAMLEGKRTALLLPSFRFYNSIWEEITRILPPEIIVISNKNEKILSLITGGFLKIHSAAFSDSFRGERYHLVAIDEAASISDLENIWEAVIYPTLIDFSGRAIFASTPKGKNFFYRLAERAKHNPEYGHWTAPTVSNPHLPFSEVEKIKALPITDYIKQELWAEFLEEGGEVFSQLQYVDDDYSPLAPFRLGIDLARSEDFTVVSGFDARGNQILLERFNKMDWNSTTRKIQEIIKPYNGNSEIIIDSTGVGAPIADRLEENGFEIQRFIFTESSRTRILENLSLLIAEGAVKFVKNELQDAEFNGFVRLLKNNKIKLESSIEHDDMVFASAMALSQGAFEIVIA